MDDTFSNQQLELRRGTIVLAILGILQQPQYGYGLLKELDISGITVDAGTLYPLLRRLEKQNILASTWDTSDARPRKYYKLSGDGLVLYASLKTEWSTLQDSLNKIIERN
jgi:PadR family transcriptional regulator, regulatory protein PadR